MYALCITFIYPVCSDSSASKKPVSCRKMNNGFSIYRLEHEIFSLIQCTLWRFVCYSFFLFSQNPFQNTVMTSKLFQTIFNREFPFCIKGKYWKEISSIWTRFLHDLRLDKNESSWNIHQIIELSKLGFKQNLQLDRLSRFERTSWWSTKKVNFYLYLKHRLKKFQGKNGIWITLIQLNSSSVPNIVCQFTL